MVAIANLQRDTGAVDVLGRIGALAKVQPDAPAAGDPVRRLSYGALVDEVAGVAGELMERKVRPDERVVLAIANSVDFVVAALACLWVGAVFVPVALTDPPSRLHKLLADCDPAVVLVSANDSELSPRSAVFAAHRQVEVGSGTGRARSAPVPTGGARPAYIIYTSGTTGSPKGVVICRQAFAAAVASTVDLLGLDPSTRTLCVSAFHFDGSYGALFPTLAAGGSVFIPPRESLVFPRNFFKALRREQITFTSFSPSYLRLLLMSPELATLPATPLRTLVLGGEACSADDLRLLWTAAPDIAVFNRYGPTETTIAVTCDRVDRSRLAAGRPVPIGRPTPGVTFTLVDEQGSVVEETGRVGELYIGGTQLMNGYWGDPDLTGQVLRDDVVAGSLLYRTGDLAWRDDEGSYVYVGRADQVVKRSGMRISLLEMSQALRAAPGVTAAACAPYDDHGRLAIAAFVAARGDMGVLQVREACAAWLPPTMLPDLVTVVENLPLTSSGKVNTHRLLAEAGLRPL